MKNIIILKNNITFFEKGKQLLFNETLKEKDLLLLANKLIGKVPDSCNAKKHYQSFISKKNTKSEIITYQPKTFENPNTVDIKSVITRHPKTSNKLSKTISRF